jgi:2-oxo-4-hydroxy-4-carboxy-5-ureidoimidazoline decarboxylase
VNARQRAAFVERYRGVYEDSPWVAECAADALDADASLEEIRQVMADCVDNAAPATLLALIRAHPDLAGKAALRGELSAESTAEQASAGLDQCSPAEYEKLHWLNAEYRRKFGFPFVMAVRGAGRSDILGRFAERLDNPPEVEFETALEEIHRIARLRLDAIAAGAD